MIFIISYQESGHKNRDNSKTLNMGILISKPNLSYFMVSIFSQAPFKNRCFQNDSIVVECLNLGEFKYYAIHKWKLTAFLID